MKELTRTLIFAGVALVSVGLAAVVEYQSKPKPLAEFEKVGREFYPGFDDPREAKILRVAAVDEQTGQLKKFEVAYENGVWRIPTHHGYPADAEDRLAETAASVIGIRREALAGRRPSEHERFGVVDPLDESVTETKGKGKRITLLKEDGTVLADYIIGKKVDVDLDDPHAFLEDRQQKPVYYVRRPDEKETYKARLEIQLSTRFSDWIDRDLLKVNTSDIVRLVFDKYDLKEKRELIRRGPVVFEVLTPEKVDEEVSILTRKDSLSDWQLDGLDPEKEELKADEVRSMVFALDDLEILGVRPKPKGLNPDLSIPENMTQSLYEDIATDMLDRGFHLRFDREAKKLELLSDKGEVMVGTNQGVLYHLHLGNVFIGTEEEIEIGQPADKQSDEDAKGETDQADAKNSADESTADGDNAKKKAAEDGNEGGENNSDEKEKNGRKEGRYLFVRVEFDESLLGPPPVKPVEPKKPETTEKPNDADASKGDQPGTDSESKDKQKPDTSKQDSATPAEEQDSADSGNKDSATTADDAEAADAAEQATTDDGSGNADGESKSETASDDDSAEKKDSATEGKDAKPADPQAEYERAMEQYRKDLEQYERKKKEYDEKIEKGRQKVRELNDRFAGWYYVISAETVKDLRLSRADLVKPKEKKEEEKPKEGETPETDAPKKEAPADGDSKPKASSDTPKPSDGQKGADSSSTPTKETDEKPKADAPSKPDDDTQPKSEDGASSPAPSNDASDEKRKSDSPAETSDAPDRS